MDVKVIIPILKSLRSFFIFLLFWLDLLLALSIGLLLLVIWIPPLHPLFLPFLPAYRFIDENVIKTVLPIANASGVTPTLTELISAILQRLTYLIFGLAGVHRLTEWDTILAVIFLILLVWESIRVYSFISYWRWERSNQIGPIQIDDFANKPELAALMRKYLFDCGAECASPVSTSAPNASPGFEKIGAAVSSSDLPQKNNIVLVFTLLDVFGSWVGIKKPGYTVTPYLSSEDNKPPFKLILEIKLTADLQLKREFCIEGDTLEEVVMKSAYQIYWYLSGRPYTLTFVPLWYRFPTAASYMYFKQATPEDFTQANEMYRKSSEEAPFNALLRLSWGDLNELNDHYLEALNIYLDAVSMWPFLYVFWYRIAVIFSIPERENESVHFEWLADEHREEFVNILKRVLMDPDFQKNISSDSNKRIDEILNNFTTLVSLNSTSHAELNSRFYELAAYIWEFLENQLKNMFLLWLQQVWVEISFWKPVERTPTRVGYYWNLICLFPWQYGSQFFRSVRLARLGTLLLLYGYSQNNNPYNQIIDTFTTTLKNDKLFVNWLKKGKNLPSWLKNNKETIPEENKKEDNPLMLNLEYFMSCCWNGMDAYYNAACFYALLYHTEKTGEDGYAKKALRYLKYAYKDPNSNLDLKWVKSDPDFKSLKKDKQFLALFDIEGDGPKEQEKEGPYKAKKYVLQLLANAATNQAQSWEKTTPASFSPISLKTVASSQVAFWLSLADLLKKPEDPDLLENFWQKSMQNSQPIPIPDQKIFKADEAQLELFWTFLERQVKAQEAVWYEHLAEIKSLPIIGHLDLKDVWQDWKQSELWQWDSITRQLKKVASTLFP